MNWYTKLKMVPRIVLPVTLVMVLCLGGLAWVIKDRSTATVTDMAQREVTALANQYANSVQAFMEVALDEALAQADILSRIKSVGAPLTRETVILMHQGVQMGNANLLASGSVWAPNAFDGRDAEYKGAPGSMADGRFAPYTVSDNPVTLIEDFESASYYQVPMKTGLAHVTEPYLYPVDGKEVLMTTAAAPVMVTDASGKATPVGVVTVDLGMDEITAMTGKIKVYQSGYGGLLSQTGVVISHPDQKLVGKNIFELGRSNNEDLRKAMAKGEPYLEKRSTGEMFYYQPINFRRAAETWYFAISAPESEVLADAVALGNLTLALSAGVLVLVLLLIFVVVRATVKPMTYIAGVAEEIAGGNLKVNIRTDNLGGEVLLLGNAMRDMVGSLVDNISKAEALSDDARQQAAKAKQAMEEAESAGREAQTKSARMLEAAGRLEQVAHVVSSASAELSAQIEQSERGASEQAARVAETATAMEEMNSTVLEVAKNAGAASQVSSETRQKAEQGAEVVQEVLGSISAVQEQSLALRADMENLGEHAQSISRIMNVISDIADQTNLLALNAAIEAARAGEAGRGFAVVADEVRKLAEKTMASTTDVGNAIRAIQQSAEKNMAQVDAAVTSIESVTDLAGQSGSALTEIVNMVDATADQVRAIATASEEQSSTSEEINRSISQVNTIAGETARAMEESARAVSELAQQAQVLMNLIDEMKKG